MAVALPDIPWSADDSTIEPMEGRIIADDAINGTTGTMITRGQILVFNLVWPLLDQAKYNQLKPFETTHIAEDITVPFDGLTYTCVQIAEAFFEHVKGTHYRGRMTLRQKNTAAVA